MKKLLSISLGITTILWLVGTAYVPIAKAAVVEGDIVSPDATFTDADGNTYYPYDVFIVKFVGTKTFKRLVLNPQVFDSYGHLKWSNIKKISATIVAGYTTASLVRAIDDTKVYKLSPNGDVGTKQWVETLACFTSKGYDWDSVYIINSTDRDNYTTGTSICGDGGPISLSLASDNPIAATLPPNAFGVTFMKINISGSGTINQMTFTRKGAGSVEDFDDLYIYENNVRLTTGRSISSATSKATFISLSIKAPTTIELVADLSATTGNVNYFAIETASEVTGTGTVSGVFPINGSPMGISGTDAGTLTVERSGSTAYNVDIGTQGAEISAFKLTSNAEGANLKRIMVFNSGDVTNNLITNLKLKDNEGTLVASADSISAGGYATFVLSPSYNLVKGTSKIFRIYADIGATKPNRTIMLYLEVKTDILAIGTTFGYGMQANITNYDSDTHIDVTCKGGDLNLVKTGPGAKNIGTDTDDTVFLEFAMSAVADITIKKTRITFCHDTGGNGSYDTLTTVLGAGPDVEDVKIKDKNSGVILVGPKDGSNIDTGTHAKACPGDITGVYEDFDDTFDILAGETKTLQVTADITVANTDVAGETALVSADKIEFVLYNWPQWIGDSGNISYVKYAGTTDAVDDSAITPSSNIAGDEMTIQSAALAIALAASPSGTDATERKFALGQTGVDMVGFVFTSAEASDIKVTGLTLTGYVDGGDINTFEPGLDSTNYVKDTIAGLELWESESNTKIASTKGWSGTNYQDMVWSGLNWTIPAGGSKTLLVKANISSSGKASGDETDNTEELFIDIPDVSVDITANDKDGNDVTATGDARNGGETAGGCLATCNPSVNISVIEKGSITFAKASDTLESKLIAMGTTNNEVSKFKITGSNEAFLIEKFSVDLLDDAVSSIAFMDDFSNVKLKYQTESQFGTEGWTISAGKTFASLATLSFSFSDSARPYVPKNDDAYVSVLVDIVDYSGGEGADSTDLFKIAMTDDTDDFDEFKALGRQSNKYVSASEPTQTDFYTHWIVRSYPLVAKEAWSGDELELARFSVTAVGGDVTFGYDADDVYNSIGDVMVSSGFEFEVISSGTDDNTSTLYLYDWNNNIISSTGAVELDEAASCSENDIAENMLTTVSFGFEEMTSDLTITKGVTKTFYVMLDSGDLADFNNSDEYIYLKWLNSNGPNSATISAANDASNFDILYWDRSDDEAESRVIEHRIGIPKNIKDIGSFTVSFRTLRGTLSE
jgi:hypothetical protein